MIGKNSPQTNTIGKRKKVRDLCASGTSHTETTMNNSRKVDSHACRLAYIDLVIDIEVRVMEAQELDRHSTADMTMNVSGRTNDDRLAEAVERVGRALYQPEGVPEEYC